MRLGGREAPTDEDAREGFQEKWGDIALRACSETTTMFLCAGHIGRFPMTSHWTSPVESNTHIGRGPIDNRVEGNRRASDFCFTTHDFASIVFCIPSRLHTRRHAQL